MSGDGRKGRKRKRQRREETVWVRLRGGKWRGKTKEAQQGDSLGGRARKIVRVSVAAENRRRNVDVAHPHGTVFSLN